MEQRIKVNKPTWYSCSHISEILVIIFAIVIFTMLGCGESGSAGSNAFEKRCFEFSNGEIFDPLMKNKTVMLYFGNFENTNHAPFLLQVPTMQGTSGVTSSVVQGNARVNSLTLDVDITNQNQFTYFQPNSFVHYSTAKINSDGSLTISKNAVVLNSNILETDNLDRSMSMSTNATSAKSKPGVLIVIPPERPIYRVNVGCSGNSVVDLSTGFVYDNCNNVIPSTCTSWGWSFICDSGTSIFGWFWAQCVPRPPTPPLVCSGGSGSGG